MRSLRITIDIALPLPTGSTASTDGDAIKELSPAVKTRLLAARDAIRALRADARDLNDRERVRAIVYVCAHAADGTAEGPCSTPTEIR